MRSLNEASTSTELINTLFRSRSEVEHNNIPNDMVLLHSALVACSLKLLTVIVSPQFQEVAQVLIAYHKVLELLKKMFGIDSRPLTASPEIIYPKGQLELNAMRLADVFSDDSNFRSFIMINFTEALAAIFLLPHGEFLSGWCSSDLPVCEDDAALE
ncbi:UNVERIFIED_CONTAM: Nodulin homeobox [Sesamum calycinum]|uniref:Nodulin homeobox n=1 Tax=Sesamum calycinum TaxID=2727403 RepID=A0AAW2SBQ0_9LAMI